MDGNDIVRQLFVNFIICSYHDDLIIGRKSVCQFFKNIKAFARIPEIRDSQNKMFVPDMIIISERTVYRLKDIQIDSVVDDSDRMIFFKQRDSDQTGKPFRRSDDSHCCDAVVQFLTFFPYFGSIIKK